MAIRSTHKVDAGFSLSSMTDLVFLLLIFFVIVSTMVSPFALPVELPKGKATTSRDKPKVAVRLTTDGADLNGKTIVSGELESALMTEMAAQGEGAPIILQVAQDVPTGDMVSVMDIAKRNNWRIVLAVAPEASGETPTPAQP
jgi:biopolymer transport protein ExbD